MPEESQANQQAQSQGQPTEAVVVPMEDPAVAATPIITADAPAPQVQPGGTNETDHPGALQGETAEQYWKRVAIANREAADKATQYGPLINHLEQNPDHVDLLQKSVDGAVIGVIAADRMAAHASAQGSVSQEDALAAELGVAPDPNTQATQAPPAPQGHQPTIEEARRMGAEQERARQEFLQFKHDMETQGVPDHAMDEFIQVLRDPAAMKLHDLFVAFTAMKERTAGGNPQPTTQGIPTPQPVATPPVAGKPISVTSLPGGQSNRPDSTAYVAEGDQTKFIQDPSNI